MARLASGAKLGYYPTPENVCDCIRRILQIEDGATALDPCCGTGEALATIVEGRATTYGIELDADRCREAEQKLDHVLPGDALNDVHITGRFDLLFLNPPYDWEDSERLETLFLRKYLPKAERGGVVVHVIPTVALERKSYTEALAMYSTELSIFRFPDGQFTDLFDQFVIFQRFGRVGVEKSDENRDHIRDVLRLFYSDPYGIPSIDGPEAQELRIPVPGSGRPITKWASDFIDPEVLEEMGKNLNIGSQLRTFSIPKISDVTPLAPLRTGHLAMLVAAGVANGLTLDAPDGQTIVIKGRVEREEECTRDDEEATTYVNRAKICIRALFLDKANRAYRLEDIS